MRLLLSTACLPEASPEELLRARQRHGMTGFEIDVSASDLPEGLESLDDIVWYRIPGDPPEHELMRWAARAHEASAGVIVTHVPPVPLGVPTAMTCNANTVYCECASAAKYAVRPCWNLDVHNLPDRQTLGVLLVSDDTRPVHIRLAGAGPEVLGPEHDDVAIVLGKFFADLSLLGYRGTLSLLPSGKEKLGLWRRWLLKERGWGCGTAAEKQRRRMQTTVSQ